VKIWSLVLQPGRKPHWVSAIFGSIISRHFFVVLGLHLTMAAREGDAPVVNAFSPVSLLAYEDSDHHSLSIFPCPSRTLSHFTRTSQPKKYFSVQGFEYFR